MQSRIKDFRAAEAQVLAICVDPSNENAKVVNELKLEYPILSDPDFKAIKPYGLLHKGAMSPAGASDLARPAVYVIDREGVVQWRALTNNWRVRIRPEDILKELAKLP